MGRYVGIDIGTTFKNNSAITFYDSETSEILIHRIYPSYKDNWLTIISKVIDTVDIINRDRDIDLVVVEDNFGYRSVCRTLDKTLGALLYGLHSKKIYNFLVCHPATIDKLIIGKVGNVNRELRKKLMADVFKSYFPQREATQDQIDSFYVCLYACKINGVQIPKTI